MASVEYALLLALLVIAGAAVWGALSESMGSLLETVANSFSRLPNP
jgi:Flp pilus assembly pilin Flp